MTATERREPPNHDTTTCYTNYSCRLPECVDRYNANEQTRKRLKQQGAYERFTDAAPVRAHVLHLVAAGAGARTIAAAAGVADGTVRQLLPVRPDGTRNPLKHRMFVETAKRILAVTPGDVIAQYVPALGTVRRLQAGVADGWPMIHLAPQVGLYERYVNALMRRAEREGAVVQGSTALQVARGYDALRKKRPGRYGATAKGIAFARAMGKDRGWPPSRYWDQFPGALDDPHFTPEYGKTRLEILAEDGHWALAGGRFDRGLVAERLEVDRSYLDRALAAHPQAGMAVAS